MATMGAGSNSQLLLLLLLLALHVVVVVLLVRQWHAGRRGSWHGGTRDACSRTGAYGAQSSTMCVHKVSVAGWSLTPLRTRGRLCLVVGVLVLVLLRGGHKVGRTGLQAAGTAAAPLLLLLCACVVAQLCWGHSKTRGAIVAGVGGGHGYSGWGSAAAAAAAAPCATPRALARGGDATGKGRRRGAAG